MTALQIIALILLPFVWMLIAAANKQHRQETGVNAPSRSAMRGIRRAARKKGISEADAYTQWLLRKQKKLGAFPTKGIARIDAPAPLLSARVVAPPRIRPPDHEPFDFEHLSGMATTYGWTLKKQAGGLFYLVDKTKKTVENPYADADAIKTDFNRRDLEDFLLTC